MKNWTIVPFGTDGNRWNGNRWNVMAGDELRASIVRTLDPKGGWAVAVHFPAVRQFDWTHHATDAADARCTAFGYVRGVERAARYYVDAIVGLRTF